MRIEVAVAGENPRMVPLTAPLTIVGSSEKVQIVLPPSTGVSRKHLQIEKEGDKIFATDLGSTNGTFLNDERLTPGKRVEFTTFFPLKLGIHVTLSLLDDEEAQTPRSSITSTTISNPDATNPQRTIVAPRVRPPGARPRVPKKKVEQKSSLNPFLILALLLGAGYWFFTKEEVAPPPVPASVPQTPVSSSPPAKKPERGEAILLVPRSEFPEPEEIKKAFGEIKCATKLEEMFCTKVPGLSGGVGGAVESIRNIILLIPEEKWFSSSSADLKIAEDRVILTATPEQRTKFLFFYFMKDLPSDIEWKGIEKNIFLVFYRSNENGPYASSIIALAPKVVPTLLENIPLEPKSKILTEGHKIFQKPSQYFEVLKSTQAIPEIILTPSEEKGPDVEPTSDVEPPAQNRYGNISVMPGESRSDNENSEDRSDDSERRRRSEDRERRRQRSSEN